MTHSRSSHLVQLNEADVLPIRAATLAAHIEAVFLDQIVPVWASLDRFEQTRQELEPWPDFFGWRQ